MSYVLNSYLLTYLLNIIIYFLRDCLHRYKLLILRYIVSRIMPYMATCCSVLCILRASPLDPSRGLSRCALSVPFVLPFPSQFGAFHCALHRDAENARHETTGKETTAPKYPKMQGWKLRETETVAQCCRGWKMRDVNIRERQSIESSWLLNTGKRGQRL